MASSTDIGAADSLGKRRKLKLFCPVGCQARAEYTIYSPEAAELPPRMRHYLPSAFGKRRNCADSIDPSLRFGPCTRFSPKSRGSIQSRRLSTAGSDGGGVAGRRLGIALIIAGNGLIRGEAIA